jgi:uncharacterized protein
MVDRVGEAEQLMTLASGRHWTRLEAPRRYGKTTLLRRVLGEAERSGMAIALVDLEGVLSLGGIVIRIERAYSRSLKGKARQAVDRLFRIWDLGLSLGAAGFAVELRANPRLDAESVLLRLLELPDELHARTGVRVLVAFDEFQDLLRVEGADGVLRSVIQHQGQSASYSFAGSAPSLMSRLFEDPSAPLLEQAVTVRLGPLPAGEVADYLADRFAATRKDPSLALDPLLRFCRGHPQRLMLLAHQLWRLTPDGGIADEETWLQARETTLDEAEHVLHAGFTALPTNEQRVAMALALSPGKPGEADVRALVGIGKGSVHAALRQLRGRGEAIDTAGGPRLTDPLLELWLRERMQS